jgi:TP901 family phage tail tape measure protein
VANKIQYGLEFNVEDLQKLINKASEFDKSMNKSLKKVSENYKKQGKERLKDQEYFNSKQISMTAFAEKELINIKKQSLLMNKKLNKIHLKELEDLYRDYYKRIKGLDDKTSTDLAKGQIDNVQKRQKIQAGANNVVGRVGKYLATSTLVYQGIAVSKAGISAMMTYEQNMANTEAALGSLTEAERASMQQLALSTDVVNKYGKSAKDVSESFEILAKAGLNAKQSMQSFEPSLQLAKLSGQSLEIATETLAQSMTELGLPMEYSQQVVDKLAYAADKSTVNIGDIAESFKIAAPAAKMYGMSINELTANIAMFGKAGLKGREAGNALSRIMLRLKKDSASKDVVEAMKNNKNFTDVLIDLQKRGYTGLTEVQKEFGLYAGKNVLQFMNIAKEAKGLTEQLDGGASVGSAMNKLNITMDTAINQIGRMKAAWENFFIANDGANTIIGDMAGGIANLLNAMKEFPDATKAVAGLTAAFVALGIAIKMTNPFIAAATIIAGIGAAALSASENIRKMNEEVAKSAGFLPNQDFSSKGKIIETATAIKRKYAMMDENQLLQEKYKLLGQINLYTEKDRKLYESQKNIPRRWDQKAFSEAEKRRTNAKRAEFYLTMMKGIIPLKDAKMELPETKEDLKTGGSSYSKKDKKQRIDDLKDYIDKMQKLQREADEIELTGLAKKIKDINNQYETLNADLDRRIEENKEKGIITTQEDIARKENEIARKKELETTLQRHRDELNKKHLEKEKELADKLLEVEKQAQEESLKNMEEYQQAKIDASERMKSLAEQYGSAIIKQDMNRIDEAKALDQLQKDAAIIGANDTEELITGIKQAHADQRIQIAYEAWQKENQIANSVMGAIGSAYDTMAQTFTDIDMNGKDRREAIWESFRSTGITAIADVIKQYVIAGIVASIFGDKVQQGVPNKEAVAAGYGAALAGIATTSLAAAIATPIFDGMAVALGAATFGANYIAAGAARASYQGTLAGASGGISIPKGDGFAGGFPVADAIVADGKVHPYRKDDLVMIGTGLGSKSNAKLPTQAMGNGGSMGMQGNMAMMRELQQLRLVVASGNASIAQAVADNTPTFTGEVLSPVKIYKRILIGERDANFIVKN